MSKKLDKQLSIIKKLHKPDTRSNICHEYDIDERTFRNYFNYRNNIKVLNVEFNHEIKEIENSWDIYMDGCNQDDVEKKDKEIFYKSSVHPVLLPLNMTEVYMLTQGILDMLEKDSITYNAYKGISEKIYSQLSDYAIERLGDNRHQLEKMDKVVYESELEMYDRLHKIKFMYAEKSRDLVKVIFENDDYIIGRVDRRGKRLILTQRDSHEEIDVDNMGVIKDIEII